MVSCGKLLGSFCVFFSLLHEAAGVTLRGVPQVLAVANSSRKTNGSRTAAARASLPQECSHCQGAGIVDPFVATNVYCKKNYDMCKCCQEALEDEKARICLSGKGGATFMGYGSCVDGIKAAIDSKKKSCQHQEDLDNYNKQRRIDEINDAMGDDSPYNLVSVNGTQLKSNSSSHRYAPRRFDSECAAYSDPNCAESDLPLCQHGYGCDYRLQVIESDLGLVQDYYGMYQNTPCLR